jgi:type I restriction enzyme S subunit
MNADRLLALFEPISEAPDAIPRLRRFILDLAVRGKLVEQDPEDEPAGELLREMGSRFKRLKITKKQVPLEAKEIPFALPDRWQWTRLGQICEKTGSGSTPRGGKEAYVETGIPFLRSQNVYNDGLRLTDVVFIDEPTHQRMAGTRVLPCDLLLNITGGSIGRCAKVPADFHEANVSQHVAIIRVGMPGTEDFIHALILSPYFQSFVDTRQTGAGRGGLPKNRMDSIPVALPPLAEQHRIVAKIDELMALCDQLEAARQEREQCRERLVAGSLQRLNQPSDDQEVFRSDARFALQVLPSLATTPAHIKQLRQTILNLAVRGKLVEQDPRDHIEGLLKKVREDQKKAFANGAIRKPVLLSHIQEDLLFAIPPEWDWIPLGGLVVQGPQNGISPKETTNPDAPKALTLAATTTGKLRPDFFKAVDLRPEQALPYRLAEGDLLFQRGNTREYVGMAAIYAIQPGNFIFPDLMIRVRLSDSLCLAYVHLALTSPPLRDYFSALATGSSETMPKINQGILCDAPIPLPPLAEQHRIVAKADALMALCDQLEQQLSQAEQSRRGLLEAVLREALAG